MIRFAESFRLHAAIADFLRQEVYRHDGIPFHSRKTDVLPARPTRTSWSPPCSAPSTRWSLVVHDEASSQMRNPFEQALIEPILRALADPARLRAGRRDGRGRGGAAPGPAGGVAAGVPRVVRARPGQRAARSGRPSTRWSGSRAASGR